MSQFDDKLKNLRQTEIDKEIEAKRLAQQKQEEEQRLREETERRISEPYIILESFITTNILAIFESIKASYCENKAELKWRRQVLYHYRDEKIKAFLSSKIKKVKVEVHAVTIIISWGEWKKWNDPYDEWGGQLLGITVTNNELFAYSGKKVNEIFNNPYGIEKSTVKSIALRNDPNWRQKLEQTLFSFISSKSCSWVDYYDNTPTSQSSDG